MPKATGSRNLGGAAAAPPNLREVLDAKSNAEAKHKSKRWQDVAGVPEDVFREYLDTGAELTRSRLLRLGREAKARTEREARPAAAVLDPSIDIRTGDFREVLADLRDIDAVITDPPYPREFLPLLADLAEWADEALAEDGILAVLMGQTHLPDVYRLLGAGRPYRWTMAYLTPGQSYSSMARRLHSNWKPVLIYGGGPRFADVITAGANDKAHHRWGQDYAGFEALVSRLTDPGAHVVDPFLGGGTTAVACRNTGRRFTGCDTDPAAIDATLHRLGEAA
jgi:hypothetical protein